MTGQIDDVCWQAANMARSGFNWGEDGRFWEHLDEHFLDLVEEVK